MIRSTKRWFMLSILCVTGILGMSAQVLDYNPNPSVIKELPSAAINAAYTSSAIHDKSWYEQEEFNYNWTDANGASHTSKFTDIATDPYQIYALLRMAYCNPNVPGIKYSGQFGKSVYYGSIGTGWGISSSEVSSPIEDGHTLFLIALKNYNGSNPSNISNKSALINYISTNIKSVELLTNGMRIGSDENEGTVFNISGNYNRFFIIGKGKSYSVNSPSANNGGDGYAPFDVMFEEYSPTTTSASAPIADFYAKMVAGEMYPVIHDCRSVIYFKHYFSMTGQSGIEEKSMTGLNIFIPDSRNVYNARNYSTSHQPQVGLYTIKLGASASLGTNESTCDVTLSWTSSLDQMAKETVPQNYTVYVVLTDEFGNESYQKLEVTPNPTGSTTMTYTVPRTQNSYTINYIVSGTPSDENYSNFFTWSNTASVVIPGMSANEILSLYVNHYESDYKSDEERNYYRNMFNVKNENIAYGLTPAMIAAGHNQFDIIRYNNGNYGNSTVVGHLTLSLSGSTVRYNIDYINQNILPGYQLNNLGIATNGSLGNYANDAIINMNSIVICDQFSTETNDNMHPSRYEYVLHENAENDPIFSNMVVIPVFKTTSTIDGYYTLNEIMDDVDATLTTNVLNTNVEMQLSNNPSVYYYTLMRGTNSTPDQIISKLQRRTDGSFLEMLNVLDYDGQVIDMEGQATKVIDRLDNNIVTGDADNYVSYQPIVWTFGNDRIKNDGENSYGAPIWKTRSGNVEIQGNRPHHQGEWVDENGELCGVYNPLLTVIGNVPEIEGAEYEPYMYRVWRLCDNVRGYVYNNLTGKYTNDPYADRSSVKLVAERITNEPSATFGEDGSLDFGAITGSNIKFIVRFYYVKKDQQTSEKPMFYVVSQDISWDATGIQEIDSEKVASKTYYNCLGVASDTPYNGLNIVVTQYTNGKTSTAKVIR